MAGDLSVEKAQKRAKIPRGMWLKREEVILNHFKGTAGIFRWLYRLMGITLLLSGLAILAVGLLEKNFVCALLGVSPIPFGIKLMKREYNGSYEKAYVEIEAALEAVRRGENESFPPEYTPETQKLREPLLEEVSGQLAVVAGVLFACAALCIGMAIWMMAFFLMETGPDAFFWGFSPVYIFLIFIGEPLGALGVVYARTAWAVRSR